MNEFWQNSVYFGALLSLGTYGIGLWMKKKFHHPIFNPLLISICICIVVLLVLRIDYTDYYEGAKYISYLLTPSTVCLAIPLYEQMEVLKKYSKGIFMGIIAGVITGLCSVLGFALMFHFSHKEYVTFLPKSITTAIGMDLSKELGGYVSITVAVIVITGLLGNLIAEGVFRIFGIREPVAKGVALGTASHAMGTAKAMELGEIEGALSSLSIVVAGILTVVFSSVFATFI